MAEVVHRASCVSGKEMADGTSTMARLVFVVILQHENANLGMQILDSNADEGERGWIKVSSSRSFPAPETMASSVSI